MAEQETMTIEGVVEAIDVPSGILKVRSGDTLYELWVLSEFFNEAGTHLVTVLPAQVGNQIKVTCFMDDDGDWCIESCEAADNA